MVLAQLAGLILILIAGKLRHMRDVECTCTAYRSELWRSHRVSRFHGMLL